MYCTNFSRKILICLIFSFQDPSKTSHFFIVGVSDVLNVDQNSRSRLIIIISIPRLTKKSTVANMFPKLDPENLTGIPLGSKLPLMRQSHPCMSMNRSGNWFKDRTFEIELGPFPLTCNPSKWGADIWGWVEVRRSAMLHYTVNQCLHWACCQYCYSGGIRGWLGFERCRLCLQDTSRNAKWHWRATVGHWVSLCVKYK